MKIRVLPCLVVSPVFAVALFLAGGVLGGEGPVVGGVAAGADDLVASLVRGTCAHNEAIADRLIVGGAKSVPPLLAAARDAGFEGRGYAAWTLGRLLRALGLSSEAANAALRDCAKIDDSKTATFATAALRALDQKTPTGGGGAWELTPAEIADALRDGNDHRAANNVLVDQLLVHGKASIPPLVRSLAAEDFSRRGYAAWALAKVLRATGEWSRPALDALRTARPGESDYASTLRRSAMRILGLPAEEVGQRQPVRVRRKPNTVRRKPNKWIAAALAEAPGPASEPAALVDALGKRKGYWNDIIVDRLIAKGDAGVAPLIAIATKAGHPGRGHAAWGLGRLIAALGQRPTGIEEILIAAKNCDDPEVKQYAAAGLVTFRLDSPKGGPRTLVRAFKTGNENVPANNLIVDCLMVRGSAAIEPLAAAVRDEQYPGRGYAAWALAKILRVTGERAEELVDLLRNAPMADSTMLILQE